jgi:hypothetical protein
MYLGSGGLNNIMMNIAEMITMQCFHPATTWLNDGRQFHQPTKARGWVKFHSIFSLTKPFSYRRKCQTTLTPINTNWNKNTTRVDTLIELYARLRPRFAVPTYDTIVHLRLERDWIVFARMCQRFDHCIFPRAVASKVANATRAAVVIAAKNTQPQLVREIRRYFGSIVQPTNHSYTHNTALQFFIGVHARVFWGNSHSTFSRGVAMTRSTRGIPLANTLQYNCVSHQLFFPSCDTGSKGVSERPSEEHSLLT